MPFKVPTPLSQASGEKRAAAGDASQQLAKKPKSLPPLSDLVAMDSAPNKKPGVSRLPAVAPLNLCIYKITEKAGDAWSRFENASGAKLWQIHTVTTLVPHVFSTSAGALLSLFVLPCVVAVALGVSGRQPSS